MGNIWQKFKVFFGHPLILGAAIIGAFVAFTINPGSLGDLMRICGGIFLFNLLIGNYRIGQVTVGHLAVLGIFLTILLINGLMPDEMIHDRSYRYFAALPGMILAIHCYSKITKPESKTLWVYCSIAILALIIHMVAYHTVERVTEPGKLETFSLYSNMHHFGSFASLILPVLFYFAIQSKGLLRLTCGVCVVGAFYLLWESTSRISWLSFFSAVLLAAFVFLRNKKLWLSLVGITAVSLSAASISGFAAIKHRISDILVNWRTEERIVVWSDTFRMLGDNSFKDWLLGHGIGSYRYYFPDYNTFEVKGKIISWNFPHNFLLQIVFENGIIGLLTISAGMALLVIGLWRGYRRLKNASDRQLLMLIFILFWINLIHGALTLSFYHKYFIYPLSMTVGISLILLEKTGQNRPLESLTWFQAFTDFLIRKIPGPSRRWRPRE